MVGRHFSNSLYLHATVRRWALRRGFAPEFLGVDAALGAASGVLVTEERRAAMKLTGKPSRRRGPVIPCIVETTPVTEVIRSMRFGS
jgi:hypothetical protein